MDSLYWDFEDDHSMFTEGACHRLAEAINEITGWPIYAFWDEWDGTGDYDCHAFVQMPDGKYLDIDGVSTGQEMLDRWHEKSIRRVDESHNVADWDGDWFDVEASIERAKELAPELVNKYGNCVASVC